MPRHRPGDNHEAFDAEALREWMSGLTSIELAPAAGVDKAATPQPSA